MDPKPPQILINNKDTKRELTSEEKEIFNSFENIPFLNETDKSNFLLVWRGLKSGSGFFIKIEDILFLGKIKEIIEKAGLFFIDLDRKDVSNPNIPCMVSINREDLELLATLWPDDHINDPRVYLELGRIYGYPKTAIDAFDKIHNSSSGHLELENELTLSSQEKRQKIPKQLLAFAKFVFSREHWGEELETVKKWAEEIKLIDPELYNTLSTRGF